MDGRSRIIFSLSPKLPAPFSHLSFFFNFFTTVKIGPDDNLNGLFLFAKSACACYSLRRTFLESGEWQMCMRSLGTY